MRVPFNAGHTRRRIYVVRHAETIDHKQSDLEYLGSTPLTTGGRRQAASVRDFLRDVPLDQAWSSDLDRSKETARIILEHHDLELISSELFRELEFGPVRMIEGARSLSQAQQQFANWHLYLNDKAPEIVTNATERAERGVAQMLASSWKDLLFVAHGGFNRFLICCLLKLPYQYIALLEQDYCGVSMIDLDVDEQSREIVRSSLRALNITPYDITKDSLRMTDAEIMATAMEQQIAKLFNEH